MKNLILDTIIIAITTLIALPAIIALFIHIHAAATIYHRRPMPQEWQAIAACETLAGARMPKATVVNYRQHPRWFYVQDGRYHCRLHWWHTGEWSGSVLTKRTIIEISEQKGN